MASKPSETAVQAPEHRCFRSLRLQVHLANERTLLDWAAMAGMLAVVGLALQGSPHGHHQVSGSVLIPAAVRPGGPAPTPDRWAKRAYGTIGM